VCSTVTGSGSATKQKDAPEVKPATVVASKVTTDQVVAQAPVVAPAKPEDNTSTAINTKEAKGANDDRNDAIGRGENDEAHSTVVLNLLSEGNSSNFITPASRSSIQSAPETAQRSDKPDHLLLRKASYTINVVKPTSSSPRNTHMSTISEESKSRSGVVISKGSFEDKYTLGEELGSGATSVVHVCIDKLTGKESAVKIIQRNQAGIDEEKFEEEIAVLRRLDHPNIIRMLDIFQTEETTFLVMELCTGGELFERILEIGHFTEHDALKLCRRLMRSVAYLHGKGIVHRDLKPENVMYASPDPKAEIKIVDFGFAKATFTVKRRLRASSKLGTRGYAAPEIFLGKPYTEKCDIWSVGIISYILLCGFPPFVQDMDFEREDSFDVKNTPFWVYVNQMCKQDGKVKPKLEFPPKYWDRVSDDARDFVAALLVFDPTKRPSANDALRHPWLREKPQWASPNAHRASSGNKGRRRSREKELLAAKALESWYGKSELPKSCLSPPNRRSRKAGSICESKSVNDLQMMNQEIEKNGNPVL